MRVVFLDETTIQKPVMSCGVQTLECNVNNVEEVKQTPFLLLTDNLYKTETPFAATRKFYRQFLLANQTKKRKENTTHTKPQQQKPNVGVRCVVYFPRFRDCDSR